MRNSKSSRNTSNNNIVLMSISDSTEERKFQAMKKNQEESKHDSSNIILNEDAFPNLIRRSQYINKVIPDGTILEYNYTREQKCCHNFVNPQYTLSLKSGGFVLNAKKQFGYLNSCYYLSVDENSYENKGSAYTGYLKGNFTGS